MGRKSQRLCISMRFMVLIPVIIVIFPPLSILSLSWFSYQVLSNSLKSSLGWSTTAKAETIITNGIMWTGDPHQPWATSLAISQGRLLSVGSLMQVQSTTGLDTKYVDLAGKFVAPGFIDSHVHFIPSGVKQTRGSRSTVDDPHILYAGGVRSLKADRTAAERVRVFGTRLKQLNNNAKRVAGAEFAFRSCSAPSGVLRIRCMVLETKPATEKKTVLHDLYEQQGQSPWYDNLSRPVTDLIPFIEKGVRGVTSNPTIFAKAISSSDNYDEQFRLLTKEGNGVEEAYWGLVVKDIQDALDLFRPIYDECKGEDGYVSVEVSPSLAHDTEGTIEAAKSLHKAVNRPYVYIKIPATADCVPSVKAVISLGISVNVTLIFSLPRYEAVIDAYLEGLEAAAAAGLDLSKISSVASFFVSRVDVLIDKKLETIGSEEALALRGKADYNKVASWRERGGSQDSCYESAAVEAEAVEMGRKSQRLCISMRFMVLIPVIIVIFPPLSIPSLSWFSYQVLSNSLKSSLGWSTTAKAETIITNGIMWTGDPHQPWATSLAISQGRLLSVGSLMQVQSTAGLDTKYVDLAGKFVAPGFIDSHVHFIPSGVKMAQLDLHHVWSRSEFISKLELAVQGVKEGVWINGYNWNHHHWGGELPDASWIDSVAPKNPVWLIRMDGHMGVANSYALALASIDQSTADPEGGNIVRDNDGVPTGLLTEHAMALIVRQIPPPTIKDRREGLVKACKLALSQGITSVVDFGSNMPGSSKELPWTDLNEVYEKFDPNETPCARVAAFMPLETWPRVAVLVKEKRHRPSAWLRIAGVKAFADGSLGSSTAFFHEPYADDSSNCGGFVTDLDWLNEAVLGADKAGLQVAIHVIGDAAVDHLLSVVDVVNSTNGPRDRRFRLEHVQHLAPGGPARVGASGVIASVQPMHLLDDANYAAKKLGEERATRGSYLFSSLLGNGTRLALGSDWNVSPLNALTGMKAAVDRTPDGWDSSWIGSESLSMEVALKGYTVDAAYASFMDGDVGSLTPGKLADFVVLSDNLLTSSTQAMPKVLATYVGGSLAYTMPSFTF